MNYGERKGEVWIIAPPDSPCGCGSGRPFGQCHLRDGSVVISPHDIKPPGKRTFHGQPGCFLKGSHDCSQKLSRDHIVSASVLRRLTDGKLHVQGPGRSFLATVSSDSLQTKYLCARHNSSLSPLDSEIGRLVGALQQADSDLASKNPQRQRLYLFSGFDIERWLLKTMCASYFAGFGSFNRHTHVLPEGIARMFESPLWRPGLGLYVPIQNASSQDLVTPFVPQASVQLHALGKQVSAISVSLAGFPVSLVVAGSGQQVAEFGPRSVYRPKYLMLNDGDAVVTIALLWDMQDEQAVWLTRGTGDPAPPGPLPTGILVD